MSEKATEEPCPLCLFACADFFYEDPRRLYLHCPRCFLIFVPRRFHLSLEEEKKRYDLHQNNPHDPAYRKFLEKLAHPIAERLPSGAEGIDFGSGPAPTLSLLLSQRGFPTVNHDPFYENNPEALQKSYDFLVCSESMEHFSRPCEEWELFLKLVRKGGWIGIMTERVEAEVDFPGWYYKMDPTHISFYSRNTFQWLAERDGLTVDFIGTSVALFRK